MAEYLDSQGIKIKRGSGDGPPETFTLIPKCVDFNGPGGQAAVKDRTNLDSLAKEKAMGLKDEGQFTFQLFYDPKDDQHEGLQTDRANRTLRNFEIELTDSPASTMTFGGYVLGFSIKGGTDQDLMADVVVEISGPVLIAAGS